jgi:hypothetical protein
MKFNSKEYILSDLFQRVQQPVTKFEAYSVSKNYELKHYEKK